jgi:hypothetical protein
MKKITIRKAGSVKLTSGASALYGDPITCPWW